MTDQDFKPLTDAMREGLDRFGPEDPTTSVYYDRQTIADLAFREAERRWPMRHGAEEEDQYSIDVEDAIFDAINRVFVAGAVFAASLRLPPAVANRACDACGHPEHYYSCVFVLTSYTDEGSHNQTCGCAHGIWLDGEEGSK